MTFAPLANDTFLKACLRQATDYTPLWLMRQAGRYLPEYKATRARAGSFMGLATNVQYATEVTLQPLERFPLDAAILFSDILTVPDAMGLGLSFAEGEGPKLAHPVRDESSAEVHNAMRAVVAVFGKPRAFISDPGSAYGKHAKAYCESQAAPAGQGPLCRRRRRVPVRGGRGGVV